MKRSNKKILTLSEHKDMMSLLKELYGTNDNAKDEAEIRNTHRETRTTRSGKVAKPTSTT